ncbi:MAG: HAD family hydrolase, partial [Planctomycetes bacterium]|nr:HAD family hydrolase [Planctomycetota bacterium]
MKLRGVIFDLDGTLVDSKLDFTAMRAEMELPRGEPILEALTAMPDGRRKRECLSILAVHERNGAEKATLMPGLRGFLAELTRRNILQGVLTRNSRQATDRMLNRLELRFSPVLTREDTAPKPDPAGLLTICEQWGVSPGETLFFGDFQFDLWAGRRAGISTVLYAEDPAPDYAHEADFHIRH